MWSRVMLVKPQPLKPSRRPTGAGPTHGWTLRSPAGPRHRLSAWPAVHEFPPDRAWCATSGMVEPVRSDHAHCAQAGGGLAQRRPDLAQESDDGGFALGAGDGGDDVRLAGKESRGITRQARARIFIGDEAHAQRRHVIWPWPAHPAPPRRPLRHGVFHEPSRRRSWCPPERRTDSPASLYGCRLPSQLLPVKPFMPAIVESDCGVIARPAWWAGRHWGNNPPAWWAAALLGTPNSGAMRAG